MEKKVVNSEILYVIIEHGKHFKGTGTRRQFVLTSQAKTDRDWHWMSCFIVPVRILFQTCYAWHSYMIILSASLVKARLHYLAIFAVISSAIFSFWRMWMSGLITNVLSACFLTWTFVTGLLVHIRQNEKIGLEIAGKVACCCLVTSVHFTRMQRGLKSFSYASCKFFAALCI